MSSELTDRDEQVLQVVEEEMDVIADDAAGPAEEITELRALVEDLATELDNLERRFTQFSTNIVKKVNRLEDAVEGEVAAVGATTLEKYASMPDGVREETLGPSDRRAVQIYEHWDELAWKVNGRYVVDTSTTAT